MTDGCPICRNFVESSDCAAGHEAIEQKKISGLVSAFRQQPFAECRKAVFSYIAVTFLE